MLQDATRCYKILQNATRCYKVLQGATRYYKMLQDTTKCYKMLQDDTMVQKTVLPKIIEKKLNESGISSRAFLFFVGYAVKRRGYKKNCLPIGMYALFINCASKSRK